MEIPNYLIELLKNEYGQEISGEIIQGYKEKRIETFRVNTLKSNREEIIKYLENNNIDYQNWSIDENVFLINNSKQIKESNLYKEGHIYFQSLSSMLPIYYLSIKENQDLLDMAASPGSKTSLIASKGNNKINITACEIDKIRMERLKYNMHLLGVENINYLNIDSTKLDDYFRFDNILLDAPCSGSGTLNVYDNSLNKFSLKLVKNSSILQKKLLAKAINILKKNETMIYSTCSILKEENEEVLKEILKNRNVELIKISLDDLNKIDDNLILLPTTIDGVLCVKPNQYYEGFFIAKLKKI